MVDIQVTCFLGVTPDKTDFLANGLDSQSLPLLETKPILKHPVFTVNIKFVETLNFCPSVRYIVRSLGFQNGRIKNSAFKASSNYNQFHIAWLGRLHRPKRGRYVGAWCARHNNHNQWLQVDLGRTMKISGIATQGRQDADQWVTSYWVLYGFDGVHFVRYKTWWSAIKVNNRLMCFFSNDGFSPESRVMACEHFSSCFESRSISCLSSVIVRVRVVFRKSAVGDSSTVSHQQQSF